MSRTVCWFSAGAASAVADAVAELLSAWGRGDDDMHAPMVRLQRAWDDLGEAS